MSNYSIKDLEQLSGIKAHTLRIWEQRYGILNPTRSDTNIRAYNDDDLKLVLNIALLKQHHYRISDIAAMNVENIGKEVLALSEKQLNYPDQIHALTISMLELDEERFEKIMATNILRVGFEATMLHIIYPFLNRIGTLWQAGSIGPAQEHFISTLIRQKLIVAIDGLVVKPNAKSKKYVLFLPEGELHEIGLLFTNYILRARQHHVVYLGQSLPLSELIFACQIHQPDNLLSILTSVPSQDEIQAYIYKLASNFSDMQIFLSGHQVLSQDLDVPSNVHLINNVQTLMDIAETRN